jgi:hypothetical protein
MASVEGCNPNSARWLTARDDSGHVIAVVNPRGRDRGLRIDSLLPRARRSHDSSVILCSSYIAFVKYPIRKEKNTRSAQGKSQFSWDCTKVPSVFEKSNAVVLKFSNWKAAIGVLYSVSCKLQATIFQAEPRTYVARLCIPSSLKRSSFSLSLYSRWTLDIAPFEASASLEGTNWPREATIWLIGRRQLGTLSRHIILARKQWIRSSKDCLAIMSFIPKYDDHYPWRPWIWLQFLA